MARFVARRQGPTTALVFILMTVTIAATALAMTAVGPAWAVQSASQGSAPLVAAQAADSSGPAGITKVNVATRVYVQDQGWQSSWTKAGKTAGTSKKALGAVKVKLTGKSKSVSGSIRYMTYDAGKGWSKTKVNGKSTGNKTKPVQAIKIWLDGDMATHYDVLYRVYVKGQGWQAWVKNKAKAGIVKNGVYVTALQVKLSAKTAAAAGTSSRVGVRYEARMAKSGWQTWKQDGQAAGKTGNNTIDGIALRVNTAGIGGSIQYRAYIQGSKWTQGWKAAGKTAGVQGKRLEGLQIKLTGNIANSYDIYYRSYVAGYGWLGWAKNGATSGSAGLNMSMAALQVVLVPKGTAGPSVGKGATVNAARKALDGIDISSWQSSLDIKSVPADFVIVKATGGKGYTNPYFLAQAYATVKSGKLLGLYHFAREKGYSGTAEQEADYFVKVAGSYIGQAVLVLDWEADALVLGPGWAKKFLDRVYAKTGVRPLIYMSKSPTREYNWSSVASSYKLWVAQYPNYKPTGYQANPWTDSYGYGAWSGPTIFQYTSTGRLSGYSGNLDLDIFYGTTSDWKKLASKS